MAYSVGATSVINSSRQLQNIASLDATTTTTISNAVASSVSPSTTAGAVGTYVFAGGGNNNTDQFNDTESGSNLTVAGIRYGGGVGASSYSNFYWSTQDESLSGTWRRMGGYHPSYASMTLFVRIS